MLDELAPLIEASKVRDLVRRLDSADPDQCIPAEYELALTWATSKLADVEMEKAIGPKMPDFHSKTLLPSGPVYVEVAALSDDPLSGEPLMKRAANIIMNHCNSVQKQSGKHLHFQFLEERGHVPVERNGLRQSKWVRRRRITREFVLSATMREQVSRWLKNTSSPLTINHTQIGVVITWRDKPVHPFANTFSSMPSEAHDLRNNPLFVVLKDKERKQLRGVPADSLKCIFLGDAGCRLLMNLKPISRALNTVSGHDIIKTFLAESSIDIVCVFSPQRANEHVVHHHNNPRVWTLFMFDRRTNGVEADFARIQSLQALLPPPNLHGYQARSWQQQGMLDPQGRGVYHAAQWSSGGSKMTVKISARGLQELLAGRISQPHWLDWITGESKIIDTALKSGKTISNIRLEKSGPDHDDDYIVMEFEPDPSASPLRSNKSA
jgi:hypothetical protein